MTRFTPTRVGRAQRDRRPTPALRFTPTRVGTTGAMVPHRIVTITRGSPPRAWGQPVALTLRRRVTVHPHARGDDSAMGIRRSSTSVGSPPRAWGRRQLAQARHERPAHGSPPRAWGRRGRVDQWPVAVSAVHPHARGDNDRARARNVAAQSVHPHARGDNAGVLSDPPPSIRFTPTRVGTTRSPTRPTSSPCGSPPRAWGRRQRDGFGGAAASVHPHARGDRPRPTALVARATVHPHARGDNVARCWPSCARTVHPHARGDNVQVSATAARADAGSPPRAWGRTTASSG